MKIGISALDSIEALIKARPDMKDRLKVLIGTDIIKYAKVDDTDARHQIYRVKQLPYIIYGEQNGTKTDNMISEIKRQGKRAGKDVPDRLPKGACRKEILELIDPIIKVINKNKEEQQELGLKLKNAIIGIEPKTEWERRIISSAEELSEILTDNQHLIGQYLLNIGNLSTFSKMKLDNKTNDSNDEPEK